MIYLDHAATSWPKPAAVLAAVQRWFTELGVSAARGDGPRQAEVATLVDETRARLAAMTGVPAERVAFVSGATEGLNLALRALLQPGDRVVTTAVEHSSVARVLHELGPTLQLQVAIVPLVGNRIHEAAVEHELALAPARLLVCSHASNVTGQVLDVARLCAAARRLGTRSLVDASQTAGHLDLRCGADGIVASAHKALLGPPGLGFVAAAAHLELPPQKFGGTGSSTALAEHPRRWPMAFEAGTPNTPAICGLLAALRWRDQHPAHLALAAALAAADRLANGLAALPGVRVVSCLDGPRVPIVSVVHERYDPSELAAILTGAGIETRSGHHCAPWVHAGLGTGAGGTLRLSPGEATTSAEIDAVLRLFAAL